MTSSPSAAPRRMLFPLPTPAPATPSGGSSRGSSGRSVRRLLPGLRSLRRRLRRPAPRPASRKIRFSGSNRSRPEVLPEGGVVQAQGLRVSAQLDPSHLARGRVGHGERGPGLHLAAEGLEDPRQPPRRVLQILQVAEAPEQIVTKRSLPRQARVGRPLDQGNPGSKFHLEVLTRHDEGAGLAVPELDPASRPGRAPRAPGRPRTRPGPTAGADPSACSRR